MITISQWGGLATNASPYGLPPGASIEQVNLQCLSPGQLNVRRGLTSTALSSSSPVIRCFLYHNNGTSNVVYQKADGTIDYT